MDTSLYSLICVYFAMTFDLSIYDLLFSDHCSEEAGFERMQLLCMYLKLEDDRILGVRRPIDPAVYSDVHDFLRRNRVVSRVSYDLLLEAVRRGYRTCTMVLLGFGVLPQEDALALALENRDKAMVYDLTPYFTHFSVRMQKLLSQTGFDDIVSEVVRIPSILHDNYDFDEMFGT